MIRRKIGPFMVNPIGLGCMNLSHAYGPPASFEQADRLIGAALDAGVDHFDTATLYGFGANEELVGKLLQGKRDKILLASKCGMEGRPDSNGVRKKTIDGHPKTLTRQCEESLRRLKLEAIDLYYLHRYDKNVPIEESVGALGDLVKKGDIRAVGLSEVSAPILRRAQKEFPISAVQTEYSLWTRNPEIAVLEATREIGAAFVAFSPLARAFLTGRLTEVESLREGDIRRAMPRFSPENFAKNRVLLPLLRDYAEKIGATPAKLALAWVLHKSENIVAIPGTTQLDHLQENFSAGALSLTPEQIAELEELIAPQKIFGGRYNAQGEAEVDTEEFDAAA